MINGNEIRRRLTNQPPRTAAIGTALDALTDAAICFGEVLAELPESREKSLAVTALEESLAWAKKCVALHQGAVDPDAGKGPFDE